MIRGKSTIEYGGKDPRTDKSRPTGKREFLFSLVFAACLSALTVVLTRFASINIGDTVRLGFGRLPVILAAFWMGPIWGMAVGTVSDILGAFLATGWNPILTVPAALCGLVSYYFFWVFGLKQREFMGKRNRFAGALLTFLAVWIVKVFCQGIVMTLLLAWQYQRFGPGFAVWALGRNLSTSLEAVVEALAVYVLGTNRGITHLLKRTGVLTRKMR